MHSHIGAILDGALAGAEAQEFLESQPPEQLTPEQFAGAVDAVMARAVPFPEFEGAMDCCGTGGDGRLTYNISTAAAFVVAARGIKVAKHGNRAVTSKSGSADVLEALGVNTHVSPAHSAKMLEEIGICFLNAPTFHPGFARIAPIRKAIGHRTIFNVIGPLCNPARVKRQLIGVFSPDLCATVAETCLLLGRENVMVVHGDDGMDEVSITGNTQVAHLTGGDIRFSILRPQDGGMAARPGRALIGGPAKQNASALRDVLSGQESVYADAVMLNAAVMLMIAGVAPTLFDGVAFARSTVARGEAMRKLERLIDMSFSDD